MSPSQIKKARAIAHPERFKIVQLLLAKPDLSVSEIYKALGMWQAVASQQLNYLKDAGVLERIKQSRSVYYRVSEPATTKGLIRAVELL